MSTVTLTLIGYVLLASGMLPFLGSGNVYGSEVDRKIEARAKKTEDKLDQLAMKQAETNATVKSIQDMLLDNLAESTQAKIRFQISKRCKTLGATEREEINREKEKLQRAHVQYTGQRYPEPACSEL